jgi:uncharacterized protein (DUF934 family)
MAIIKDGKIAGNDWRHVADDAVLPEGNASVSLKRWKAEKDSLTVRNAPLAVRLTADDAPEDIADDLKRFGLIVLDMAHFADGRVFTQAALLRERYGFTGELRVRGDFLRDQMFYLARVGVNAFEFADGVNLEEMRPALGEFTVKYQASADVREPLYRRRR